MSTITYTISLQGGGLLEATGAITKEVAPLVHQAVRAVAQGVTAQWQANVQKAKLWSVEKDAYAQSIKWEMTGDFSATVSTDYKLAEDIENGRPQRDLKRMLDTSMKVRRTQDGRRFLVIPFRHNTPGHGAHAKAMPGTVYEMVKGMAASKVVGTSTRRSGETTTLSPKTGMHPAAKQTPYLSDPRTRGAAQVAKRSYAWGDRLTPGQLKSAGLSAAEAKRYAGMVKMDTSTPGGAKSSSYMTFRIMMEGSKGWIVPAKPGLYLARNTAMEMQPKAAEAFKIALEKTIKSA